MIDFRGLHSGGGEVQSTELVRRGCVVVKCLGIWDGGCDGGKNLFGVEDHWLGD